MADVSRPLVDYEEEEEEEEERSSDEEYIVPKKRVRVQKTDEGKCFIIAHLSHISSGKHVLACDAREHASLITSTAHVCSPVI